MTGQEIGSAVLAGLGIGTLIIAGFAARTAWAITKAGNWPNVFRLAGMRYH